MKFLCCRFVLLLIAIGCFFSGAAFASPLKLTRADYADRAHAAWVAQIAAVLLGFPFEHQTASVEWVKEYPKPYMHAIVDDDWYYEMSALRAFEKHGTGLTIQQLGEQWRVDRCGTWGSSREAWNAASRRQTPGIRVTTGRGGQLGRSSARRFMD